MKSPSLILSEQPIRCAVTESEDDEVNDYMDMADATELVSKVDQLKSSDSLINKALMKVRGVIERIKARLKKLDTSDEHGCPTSTMPQPSQQSSQI